MVWKRSAKFNLFIHKFCAMDSTAMAMESSVFCFSIFAKMYPMMNPKIATEYPRKSI